MKSWYKIAMERRAGVAEVPPKLLESIIEAVNDFNETDEAHKHIQIPIDLTGWKYGGNELLEKDKAKMMDTWLNFPANVSAKLLKCEEEEVEEKIEEMLNISSKHMGLSLYKRTPSGNILGKPTTSQPATYMPRLGFMSVLTTAYPRLLDRFIKHELIHYGQALFERLQGKYGFLPKRNISDNNLDTQPSSINQYYLSDAEFQPLLHDVVYDLQNVLSKGVDKKEALEQVIADNPFLANLKQHNYEKYKNALTELYKSL